MHTRSVHSFDGRARQTSDALQAGDTDSRPDGAQDAGGYGARKVNVRLHISRFLRFTTFRYCDTVT